MLPWWLVYRKNSGASIFLPSTAISGDSLFFRQPEQTKPKRYILWKPTPTTKRIPLGPCLQAGSGKQLRRIVKLIESAKPCLHVARGRHSMLMTGILRNERALPQGCGKALAC